MRASFVSAIVFAIVASASALLGSGTALAGPVQLFAQGEVGYSYASIASAGSNGRLVPAINTLSGSGYGGGATAGVRLLFIDVALHGHLSHLDSASNPSDPSRSGFDLGQLQLLAQLHAPVWLIDPYLRLGFGYAWLGSPPVAEIVSRSFSTPNGWSPTIGVGIDAWLGKLVTLGAGLDFSGIFLHRSSFTGSTGCSGNAACDELARDGDGAGFMFNAQVRLGLHLL